MEQRLSLVTLCVADVGRSQRFYESLGWSHGFANETIVFFQLNGIVFALFERRAYMADANLERAPGHGSVALAHNVRTRDEVEPLIARMVDGGALLVKPAAEPPWGGYSGYVADPDGHIWEIAWNPQWTLDATGAVTLGA